MTTRTQVSAAAPAWVGALVAGPEQVARVVHRGADAVYLDVAGVCVGVLSAAATGVPCAVRTALALLPADLLSGETAVVGAGRIALGGTDVVVTRTLSTAVPRLASGTVPSAAARLVTAVGDRRLAARAELPEPALEDLADGRSRAVRALLGRGSGLTPLGDDVLAGWFATTVAAGASGDAVAAVRDEVVGHASRMTTLLSATLLACAVRGDVLPQFRTLLQDLADPAAHVGGSVDDLLRVGHTSGAGLLLGTDLALRHLASRSSS